MNYEDLEVLTQHPCLLGHPVSFCFFYHPLVQDSMNVKKSGKVYIRCMGGDEDVSLRQTFFFLPSLNLKQWKINWLKPIFMKDL